MLPIRQTGRLTRKRIPRTLLLLVLCGLALPACADVREMTGAARPAGENVAAGGPSNAVTAEFPAGDWIFIQARINDSGPLWFVLDSGSDSLLVDAGRARAIGLKLEGSTTFGGAGEQTLTASLARDVSFHLPGASVTNLSATVTDLGYLSAESGREVSGVVGHPLLSRYVVEIDYEAGSLKLHEPASYAYAGAGESVPISLERGHPHVRARLTRAGGEPVEAKLLVDTGALTFTGLLTRPFVERHRLLASSRTIRIPGARGAGGETRLLAGRARSLQVGRFVIQNPLVGFSQDRAGFGASTEVDGLVGNELMRRFRVIFDYSRGRMILEPNTRFAEPYEATMSGVRLQAEGADFKTFRVHRVFDNSPASEAGVRAGDLVEAVDGRPAREFTLGGLNEMFKTEGRECVLGVKRGAESKELRLKLRRLI